MQKKIREHVMNPANDFTKVLPHGKTKVNDARALVVSKAEVYLTFPYKSEIPQTSEPGYTRRIFVRYATAIPMSWGGR